MIYVHLWIAEGIVRKWLFPQAGDLAYVFRDALLFAALPFAIIGLRRRRRASQALMFALLASTLALAAIAVVDVAWRNLPVQLVILGWRSYAAPLMLPFLAIGYVSHKGIEAAERAIVAWLPVQAALTIGQALSPHASFINQVAPGEFQAIAISGDVYRATGTFTAPIGLTSYATLAFALASALLLRSGLPRRPLDKVLAWIGLGSAVLITVVSGSRGLVAAVVAIALALLLSKSKQLRRRAALTLLVGLGATAICFTVFPGVVAAFGERIQNAQQSEDLTARIVDAMFGYLNPSVMTTLLGDGLGVHANFAPTYGVLEGWIEPDLMRMVAESGLIGLLLALARTALGIWILARLFGSRWPRHASLLTLGAATAPIFLAGSIIAQPSTQGAAAVGAALLAWHALRERPIGSDNNSRDTSSPAHAPRFHGDLGLARLTTDHRKVRAPTSKASPSYFIRPTPSGWPGT